MNSAHQSPVAVDTTTRYPFLLVPVFLGFKLPEISDLKPTMPWPRLSLGLWGSHEGQGRKYRADGAADKGQRMGALGRNNMKQNCRQWCMGIAVCRQNNTQHKHGRGSRYSKHFPCQNLFRAHKIQVQTTE
jgi:hypothetical protein